MKISTAQADQFVAAPRSEVNVALVYGPDNGLATARIGKLAEKFSTDLNNPFQVARLDGPSLRKETKRFWDEVSALALSGDRRLVIIRDAGDAVAEVVEQFLQDTAEQPAEATMVLLEAGELTARSKLRRACEAAGNAAAIACYPLEGRALRDYISATLAGLEVKIDRAAADYLAHALRADHGLRESELTKLALYGGTGSQLGLLDVMDCIGDTSDAALSELALAVGSGDSQLADRLVAKIIADGISPVAVLRAVQSHFARLHRAALARSSGQDPAGAMASLRPPVFWRDKDRFVRQLSAWTSDQLAIVISRLVATETLLKTTGQPAAEVLHHDLFAIAGLGRRMMRGGR